MTQGVLFTPWGDASAVYVLGPSMAQAKFWRRRVADLPGPDPIAVPCDARYVEHHGGADMAGTFVLVLGDWSGVGTATIAARNALTSAAASRGATILEPWKLPRDIREALQL